MPGILVPPALIPISSPGQGKYAIPFAFDFAQQPLTQQFIGGRPWQGSLFSLNLQSVFNNVVQSSIQSMQISGFYNGDGMSAGVFMNPLIIDIPDTGQEIFLGSGTTVGGPTPTAPYPMFSAMIPLVCSQSSNINFFDVVASDDNHYLQIFCTLYNFPNNPYVYKNQ